MYTEAAIVSRGSYHER